MKSRIISSFLAILLSLTPLLVFGQVPSAPVITGFSPTAHCSGGTVTIVGRNFVNVQSVRFGGTRAASFVVNQNGDSIRAILGQGATGAITVQTTIATVTSAITFTYLGSVSQSILTNVLPFPIVVRDSSVEATLVGSFVTNCLGESGVVILSKQVGNSLLSETFIPTIRSRTERTFTVPAAFVRTPGNIRCYFDDRVSLARTTTLTVTASQTPRITSLSPSSTNATGQAFQLTINGEGFFGNVNVQFGGVTIPTFSTSATRIVANVPAALNVISTNDVRVILPDNLTLLSFLTIGERLDVPAFTGIRVRGGFVDILGDNFVTGATVIIGYASVSMGLQFSLPVINISQGIITVTISSTIASAIPRNADVYFIITNPDGQFTFGYLPRVSVAQSSNAPLHLYPNPTHETTTIETNADTPRTLTFTLRTVLGQEVMRFSRDVLAGRVLTPLDVHSLSAGTYFLEIQSGTERVVERLVKY